MAGDGSSIGGPPLGLEQRRHGGQGLVGVAGADRRGVLTVGVGVELVAEAGDVLGGDVDVAGQLAEVGGPGVDQLGLHVVAVRRSRSGGVHGRDQGGLVEGLAAQGDRATTRVGAGVVAPAVVVAEVVVGAGGGKRKESESEGRGKRAS